jgi:hypothetical protein
MIWAILFETAKPIALWPSLAIRFEGLGQRSQVCVGLGWGGSMAILFETAKLNASGGWRILFETAKLNAAWVDGGGELTSQRDRYRADYVGWWFRSGGGVLGGE